MYQNIFVTGRTDIEESLVYLWDDTAGLLIQPYKQFEYAYKVDSNGDYVSIYGDRLKRIHRYKWDDPSLYESDLPRETRVLTDLYLEDDMPSINHRILITDIEVDSTGGFATPEKADKEITAIANHDSIKDHYTVFLLDPVGQIDSQTNGNETVISCKTEDELLRGWLEYYKELNPTIITGWNIDNYDIPYLYNRLKRVFTAEIAKMLSPIGIVKFSQYRNRFSLAGVSVLDYLALYKKFTYSQKPSYRLDAIGKSEVGMGKVEYEGTLDTLYKTDIKKFLDYNLNDVQIVRAIDQKMKLIELARFICHMGHVPYEDFGYSSKFIEGTIVTYLHRKGIICANKPLNGREEFAKKQENDEEGFAGAFVKAPFPGLYDWVYSLDLQSLYPSIIMSLNISPDTKKGRVYNWNVDSHVRKEIDVYEVQLGDESTERMSRDEFINFLVAKGLSISSNGILYSNGRKGIIPEILDQWFEARVEFKNKMKSFIKEGNEEMADFYDRRQHVQKILLNCFSPDTDVVTPNGIKNIRDLKVGDLVYSLNPETGNSEIKSVTRTYEYDYEGEMVQFKSKHIDFLTTPNHRFLLASANSPNKYRWVYSGDVMNMATRQNFPSKLPLLGIKWISTVNLLDWVDREVVIKNNKIRDERLHTKFQPFEYCANDWLEFLGWYISEGSVYKTTRKTFPSGNVRGESFSVHIAQEKYHDHVKLLLDRMGIEYYKDRKGFKITSQIIHSILINQCGEKSETKMIPRWVFDLHPDQLHHLFTGLMMGDGDVNMQRYTTKSKILADGVVELALRLGYQAFICKSELAMYRVQINSSRGIKPCLKVENKALVPYSGKVYCVEVADNHTLYCGRNGKYNWCGQSIYGVLGLPIFRFYDLDNALAVTATGQDVIKTTAKYINGQYLKLGAASKSDTWVKEYQMVLEDHAKKGETVDPVSKTDHCVYIDTDSVYFSAEPLFHRYPEENPKSVTIKVAKEMEQGVNKFYDVMAKMLFNCDSHRFYIKGEAVMQTGFWVAKKRYVMKKVYDLETDQDLDGKKPKVKGLDVVRSSFPPAFAKFMTEILMDILNKTSKDIIDKKILEFREAITKMDYLLIARNTSVKKVSEYDDPNEKSLTKFKSGAPAHSKAAVTYNRLIRKWGIQNQYAQIIDGDKIKWVYLRKNPLGIDTVAVKAYDDPPQIVELVEKYIDHEQLFDKELCNKLSDFYSALKWGMLPTDINQSAFEFFDF